MIFLFYFFLRFTHVKESTQIYMLNNTEKKLWYWVENYFESFKIYPWYALYALAQEDSNAFSGLASTAAR